MGRKWKKVQLQNATALRTDEHHTWVYIFITSLTTTSILLVALFNNGVFPKKGVGLTICIFGTAISAILAYIQYRALRAMKAQEKIIKKIEKFLCYKSSKPKPESKKRKSNSFGARQLMLIVGIVQVFFWIIGILYFFKFS